MKIYEFDIVEGQEWALPVDKKDYFDVFRRFDGTPLRDNWRPVRVYLLKEDEGQRCYYSDMPCLGAHVPVLRRPAIDALGDVLSRYGELLPLECDEAELYAFNCCTMVDALDIDRSELVRFPSSGRIMRVESYVFKPEVLRGVQVFKIPQKPLGSVFVDQSVVDLAERAGLKRVAFRLLWESDEGE